MQVQRDDAGQADRIVMEFLRSHSPTTMDTLLRSLLTLSWAQVFSAVDRLSRTHQILLQQTPHRDYEIRIRDCVIRRHVVTEVMGENSPSILRS
jgi:hypothetical protein